MNILASAVDFYLVLKSGTHDQILEMLGNEMIDLNGRYDVAGDTVYHAVLRNKSLTEEQIIAISRIFRERGVNPAALNRHAKSPLHLAIENRMRDVGNFYLTYSPRLPGNYYALTRCFVEDEIKQFWPQVREDYGALKPWDSEKMENESANFLRWLIANEYHGIGEDGDFELTMLLRLAVDCNLKHILPVLLEHASERIISNREHESLLQLYLKQHAFVKRVLNDYRSRDWYSKYTSRHAISILEILLDKGAVVDLSSVRLTVVEIQDMAIIKRMIDRLPVGDDEGTLTSILKNLMKLHPNDAAASEHYRQTLSALVSKGANVNEGNEFRMSAIQVAMEARNAQGVLWSIEAGADLSVLTIFNKNLLHLLLEGPRTEASHDDLAIFDLLLDKGCEINARDSSGLTPLHVAVMNNNFLLTKRLIENDAEIDCRDESKRTPLHYAARQIDSIDMVEMLLENGANVNARDIWGKGPLFLAVHAALRKCRMVEVLLERGAQVNMLHLVRDKLALKRVVDRVDVRLVEEFLKYGLEVKDSRFNRLVFARRCDIGRLLNLHNFKLEVAALPVGLKSSFPDDKQRKYHEICSREIKVLKMTFIDTRTSLYRLLHLGLNERRIYINNGKLKSLVESPVIKKQFPVYAVVILANYREAVMRRSLLEPAKAAWLQLTGIALPDICIERIFSYLSNMKLINIINGV